MFNTLIKKVAVAAAGMAVASTVDSVVERPKGMNPTLARVGVVAATLIGWEFAEAAMERKLGITDKKR